jgi:hypothetical protein
MEGAMIDVLESRRLLAAVGPDGYGYIADAHPFENINLPTGVGTERNFPDLGDNKFNFYGRNYTGAQLRVGFDGIISFGNAVNRVNTNLAGAPFDRILAPLWDSWGTSGATVQQVNHRLEDTAGDSTPDRLIVQWNVTDPSIPREQRETAIFQAILQLNTGDAPGDITFNYVTLDTGSAARSNGASATVGIKDFGYNSNRLLISLNDANNPLVGSGKAIRIHADFANQPRASTGGGASRDEGPGPLQVTLDGSGSTDFNQAPATLNYAWDFDLDGIYGETADNSFGDERGINPTYIRPDDADGNADGIIDGPLTLPVVLRVIDSSGFVSYDEGFVVVNNVQPSAPTITGPTSVAAGGVLTWQLSATDPGDDVVGFQIDWGDERPGSAASDGVATHAYSQPGTYTVRVFAHDSAGGTFPNQVSRTVTVGPRPDVLLNSFGTLFVTTAGGDDTIAITLTGGQVRLDRNGTITTYDPGDVQAVDIDAGDGDNTVSTSLDVDTTILTGAGADSVAMTGNDFNRVTAGDGNNTITGGDGFDDIVTGTGNDVIDAGGGDNNAVRAGDGNNHVTLPAGFVSTGAGDDTVLGAGIDDYNLELGDGDNVVNITTVAAFNSITTGSGDDSISTGAGPDRITSGDGADTISAGGNGDHIITGAGDSSIDAGAGDDDVTVQSAVSIAGGDGNDRITAMVFAGTIDAGAGNDLVRANSDAMHPAVLRGGDGSDNLFTADGHDAIYGGAGKDTVHAGSGSDLISGGGGHDLLFGQGGKDRLYGGDGNDRLFGQRANDRLTGGEGADTINGGSGTDLADEGPVDLLISIEGSLV